jgi:PAS domain S-box-containing protein
MKPLIEDKMSPDSGDSKEITEMKLDAILQASHDGLWIIDKEGTVLHVNKAALKINNLEEKDAIGQNIREIRQRSFFANQKLASLEVLEKKKACSIIQDLPNGKKLLVTGTPFMDDKGNLTLIVVNDRDISHLYHLTAELERNKVILENLNFQRMYTNQIDFSDVVAQSAAMKSVIDQAVQISKFDTTVLIQGETGVGKNIIAQLIHNLSERKNKPFISINCSSIPEPLIESELFGYDYGAFTNSSRSGKKGLVEMADEGTLFLDEIGDLPLSAQTKILKFIENKEITHLGSNVTKKLNLRFITATNKDLKDMVNKGIFRQDLLYRINVISIFIPPLRERKEDIRSLVRFFLNKTNKKYQLEKEIFPDALELLTNLPYPGNVRELENIVESLAVTSKEKRIYISDLPSSVKKIIGFSKGETLKEAVLRFQFKLIASTLREHKTQERAARVLGIHQTTLARKINRFRKFFNSIVHEDTP